MYPKLEINLSGIIDNFKKINQMCKENNIKLSLVTKIFSGNVAILSELVKNGVTCICESRVQNFVHYQDLQVEKWLIRIPMLSEISSVIQYTDVSLNSELTTIKALNEEAKKQNKIHKIILMYELGDIREGCSKEELEKMIPECLSLSNIELYGIGTNLSCFGEVLPTKENMQELVQVVEDLEIKFNIHFPIISGGNSTSFQLLENHQLPDKINNLRLGESVFFGNIPCFNEPISFLNQQNFILKAQVIEAKEKSSVPRGKVASVNSLGEAMHFEDKGMRKKVILGIGRQDVKTDNIFPVDKNVTVLGASSDHTILDVSDSKEKYQVGDIVSLSMNYASVLQAMTSPYIEKEIIEE